jgi:hypothetical protein
MAQLINVKTSDTRVEVKLTDWRYLIRETKRIDPRVLASFRDNARDLGRPVEAAVQKAIPNRRPLSGMQPKVIPGRLAWGAVVPAKQTEIKVDTRIRKKGRSIVSVWVMSPAVAMVDMARKQGSKGITSEYDYSRSPTGKRRHRINGQGKAMIKGVSASNGVRSRNASRYAWPSAIASLNIVNAKMLALVNRTANQINAEIMRNIK